MKVQLVKTINGYFNMIRSRSPHMKYEATLNPLYVKEWDGIVGYLTTNKAYCLWVGYHFQVKIYSDEDEAI